MTTTNMKRRLPINLPDPWRFHEGDCVCARGWPAEAVLTIVRRVPPNQLPHTPGMASALSAGCPIVPHYEARDHLGGIWLMSQLNIYPVKP